MNYKILCSDLDGTLLSTKSDVSDFTVSEINRIKETTRIILVSARMPKAMRYIQERLGIGHEPIICYNGALILDNKTEILSITIDLKSVEDLYRTVEENSINLGLYYKDEWYVEEKTERVSKEIEHTKAIPVYRNTKDTLKDWNKRNIDPHKIMLMGAQKSIDTILPDLRDTFNHKLNVYRSNDTLIEVAPKPVSKLSAIKILMSKNYALEDVIAFGDNYNDIEMLKNAGYGVAVANGRDEAKAIADYITLPNTKDGVAHFIRQHILI